MSLPASRFTAALLALSTFALPAWAANNLIEPIGWSADEARVAVRAYDFVDTEFNEDAEECKGYVDHKGQSFTGSLSFEVYEKGKRIATFPIQDSEKCTPPKTAKARLTKAKAELLKLGIDLTLKQPGTVLTPESGEKGTLVSIQEGPGAPYTLEAERKGTVTLIRDSSEPAPPPKPAGEEEEEEDDINLERREKGELRVFVNQGGQRRQLAAKKYDYSYVPAIGDMLEVKLAQVWLSPKGKTALFISEYISGSMRGRTDVLEVMGGASWDGVPVVLR
jgi:hypothetical protein